MKVNNRKCQPFVDRCEPFEGSNLSGVKISDKIYVVYSYGYYPLWARIDGQWYGQKDKYSTTTSCHTSASKPSSQNIHILDTVELLEAKIAGTNAV
jgi:hypothetical protein